MSGTDVDVLGTGTLFTGGAVGVGICLTVFFTAGFASLLERCLARVLTTAKLRVDLITRGDAELILLTTTMLVSYLSIVGVELLWFRDEGLALLCHVPKLADNVIFPHRPVNSTMWGRLRLYPKDQA